MWPFQKPKRIYLDHAAATPVLPEVETAMRPYFNDVYGNPSAIHQEGKRAHEVVEEARTDVARTLSVRPSDVTFTSGGTESNNLALRGFVDACVENGVVPDDIEIIATRTEHPSINATLAALEATGCIVTYLPISEDGLTSPEVLAAHLTEKTRLVTIAYANSETGVVQDLSALSRVLKKHERNTGNEIIFHTDASQAPCWLPCQLERCGVDMMTLDSGKFGGPKGCGVLVHRPRASLQGITYGGGQEDGLRPGTENVPLIVGCTRALVTAQSDYTHRTDKVTQVRDYAIEQLTAIEGVVLNGSREQRLANNINISIPGIDTEFAVVTLDTYGIAASTRSACSGAGSGRSEVVYAMTEDPDRAAATLRLTLGVETTKRDIDRVVSVLATHIAKMRNFHQSA